MPNNRPGSYGTFGINNSMEDIMGSNMNGGIRHQRLESGQHVVVPDFSSKEPKNDEIYHEEDEIPSVNHPQIARKANEPFKNIGAKGSAFKSTNQQSNSLAMSIKRPHQDSPPHPKLYESKSHMSYHKEEPPKLEIKLELSGGEENEMKNSQEESQEDSSDEDDLFMESNKNEKPKNTNQKLDKRDIEEHEDDSEDIDEDALFVEW